MASNTIVTKIFADRLQDLITRSGKEMRVLSKEIGVASGALSKYQNDGAEPGINNLKKIADYFGVTTEFLLGRTNAQNNETGDICERLGLSELAV